MTANISLPWVAHIDKMYDCTNTVNSVLMREVKQVQLHRHAALELKLHVVFCLPDHQDNVVLGKVLVQYCITT